MVQRLWKSVWRFLTKLNIPFDLGILLLGVYPREMKTSVLHTKTCTQIFIAALFIIAQTGPKFGETKCPSTSEWINKQRCICAMEYSSAMKREQAVDLCGSLVEESQRYHTE